MKRAGLSRRGFFRSSVTLTAPVMVSANSIQFLAADRERPSGRPLKVVCVGAHPDDPESGCAGTLARYSQAGHGVSIVYLTRGERGIRGKGLDESAKIRSAECEAACKIIGATPV